MRIPWWVWVLAGLIVLVLLGLRAARSWRALVRRELIAYLADAAPDLRVEHERDRVLLLRDAGGEQITLFLHRLFQHTSALKPDDIEGRQAAFGMLLSTLREQRSAAEIEPTRDRARLRPRLLAEGDLAAMISQSGATAMPSFGFGVPGLVAVLVLDAPSSVAYVDATTLALLELSGDEALALAKENLRSSFPEPEVRQAIAQNTLTVIKTMDTFDAARLLLLPEYLRDGERMIAFIPDRDTLAVMPEPEQRDERSLRALARNAAGDPLWREPLLVSPAGIAPA